MENFGFKVDLKTQIVLEIIAVSTENSFFGPKLNWQNEAAVDSIQFAQAAATETSASFRLALGDDQRAIRAAVLGQPFGEILRRVDRLEPQQRAGPTQAGRLRHRFPG